jgi:phosphoribosyl-ATP pyrophosphohydrolase/phosphoribosyl-AMP cyclohydrolase
MDVLGEGPRTEPLTLATLLAQARTPLLAVVVQDATTAEVLMVAYANAEAVRLTVETGQAWFWSRSRQALWHKGATSGHTMRVMEILVDCDADTLLYRVQPAGPACHTGARSCFFRRLE